MRRAALAQRILAIATPSERAAAVVGDLLEEEASHGRRWFWPTIARTALAFVWLDIARLVSGRHPAFSGGDIMGQIMNVGRFVLSHKRLIVIPVVLFTTATSLVAYSMPVRYRSEALILITPQRVPEKYVRSTGATELADRLLSVAQKTLTHSRLEMIIQELDLYKEERHRGAMMDDVVNRMRADIATSVEKRGVPFFMSHDLSRMSYVGNDPRVVKDVTEKLASLFISEIDRDRDRKNIADGTNPFLDSAIQSLAQEVDKLASAMEQALAARRPLPPSQVIEYEALQDSYRALLSKREEARLAANLEGRNIGEQFTVIEAPRVPTRPFGPHRLGLSLLGASAGLGLGVVLMLRSSMRRPT